MTNETMIGVDLAKAVFQVHGASMTGEPMFRKKLSRQSFSEFMAKQSPALVVMEACGSAHHWAREMIRLGHEVKLIAPRYVKPFVKRQKNDAADAEAIVIAARQPEMRFVEPKGAEQQSRAILFRAREGLVHQRTELINALRAALYEYGHVVSQGIRQIGRIEDILEAAQLFERPLSADDRSGGYVLASYASAAINAQAGVHLDHTDQSTVGRIKRNGVFVDQPTRSSYTYVLPSAIATWHATRAVDLRAAASQTIGRASYDSYAARSSISFVNASDLGNGAATGVNVTIGNPDIKPRLSTNLDLATDWTLSSRYGGIVSLAAFYKTIKDEIFNAASVGYTYEGVDYVNAVVTRPTNATKASIKGIEASAVLNSLEFIHPILGGFGVSANAALLRGRIDVLSSAGVARSIDRLVGQPDSTLNASIFYAKHGLELRAAYNRQGRALRTIINDIYWQDLYWAPREQVDLTANYTLRNGVAVIGQVSNLTHTRLTSFAGPDRNLLKDSYSVPTTIWLGLRFTPRF